MEAFVPKVGNVRVKRDGLNVIIEYRAGTDVSSINVIPWDAALEVARALMVQVKRIQEDVNAGRLISDQALLIRLGIPLGLANNPNIKKEAFKDAQYDPLLRKYITGPRVKGIPSGEVVGTPGLIQHPPKGGNNGLQ